MSRLARILIAVASALLLGALVTPIWKIHLDAPQYPEGLGMQIRAHSMRGESEHDLDNINELNHYIGMRPIEARSFPELEIMPWVIGGLATFGFIVVAAGKRPLLWTWVVLLIGLGSAGLADFWRWERGYGRNLDLEHAIIKVPGMVYSPPLIGTKQLLNFTASSWPGAGGIFAGVAFVLAVAAVWMSRRRPQARHA